MNGKLLKRLGACLLLLTVLALVLLPMMAMAATASWNANAEPDLAGYRLYRAPGACANPGAYATVQTYPREATSGAIPNPSIDGRSCHRMTAFDTAGNESPFSLTVEFDYNVVPPVAPTGFAVTP